MTTREMDVCNDLPPVARLVPERMIYLLLRLRLKLRRDLAFSDFGKKFDVALNININFLIPGN
jgi:hypothetical protein